MELVNREEEAELERLSPEDSRRALNDLFEFARHFPDPEREAEVAVVRARWVRAKRALDPRLAKNVD